MTKQERNKQNTIAFFDTFVNQNQPRLAMETYGASYYRQHNPGVKDGCQGFVDFFEAFGAKVGPRSCRVVRAIAEDDLVMVHVWYLSMPPFCPEPKSEEALTKYAMLSIDIFRFTEDGKIMEHWDTLQRNPCPAQWNPPAPHWWGDHSYPTLDAVQGTQTAMGGETQIKDLDKTQQNKEIARGFAQNVLMNQQWALFPDYVDPNLIQHIAYLEDGTTAYLSGLQSLEATLGLRYICPLRTVAEGNFVCIQSLADYRGRRTSVMDLFQLKNGKICEVWQRFNEMIPDTFAHQNTMF